MKKLLLPFMLLLLWSSTVWAAMTPPDVLVKSTTEEVLNVLRKDKGMLNDDNKVYALVEEKVLPNFDFDRMTQLAVGRYWRQATPAQKEELVRQFKALLVRTYAGSLHAFNNQTVDFRPFAMQPDATDVTVKTIIQQPGGQAPLPVDYSLYKTPYGWKVYDVAIDNVSLVLNYRSSFGQVVRRSGINGLIESLQAKNGKTTH